jgi:hypothetical protein
MDEVLKTLTQAIVTLASHNTVKEAQLNTLRQMCFAIARASGISELDGKPLESWHAQVLLDQLELSLRKVEDSNPKLGAMIQAQIDELRGS